MGVNAHVLTWIIAFVLFFLALRLHYVGKGKAFTVVQMVLRLFYLLIILSGILLVTQIQTIGFLYILKMVVGVWVITAMEFVLNRMTKQKQTGVFWIQFFVSVILVLYLGYKLPLGMQFF